MLALEIGQLPSPVPGLRRFDAASISVTVSPSAANARGSSSQARSSATPRPRRSRRYRRLRRLDGAAALDLRRERDRQPGAELGALPEEVLEALAVDL